jgi:hypothetical protein
MTPALLRRARDTAVFAPAPLSGHAVTREVAAELSDLDEEEREYLAMTAAAMDALVLLADDDPPVRLVAAVDVPDALPADGPDDAASAVVVGHEVGLDRLAAVHADSPDAAADVAAARAEMQSGDGGEPGPAVRRCLDRDLGWFATQEIDALLEELARG